MRGHKDYNIKIKAGVHNDCDKFSSVFKYQEEAVDNLKILDTQFPEYYSTLVIVPTGGGKTRIAVEYLYHNVLNKKKQKVLWIAERLLLLEQTYSTFKNLADKAHLPDKMESEIITRLVSSKHGNYADADFNKDVDLVIITQQTLEKKIDRQSKIIEKMEQWLDGAEGLTVIIDEAHHATAAPYKAILSSLAKLQKDKVFKAYHVIGLTATPKRNGSDDIEKIFSFGVMENRQGKTATGETSYAYQISINDLVASGVLSHPYMVQIEQDEDKDIISTYIKGMERLGFYDGSNGGKAKMDVELPDSFGQTILFAKGRIHALKLEKMFQDAGVVCGLAVSLDAKFQGEFEKKESQSLERFLGMTISEKRKKIKKDILDYKIGKLKLIITADMLLEGVDYPKTQTVFIAKGDMADDVVITQMVGRALRGIYQKGTPTAFIVNFGENRLERILWEIPESYQEGRKGGEPIDEDIRLSKSVVPKLIEPQPLSDSNFKEWDESEKDRFFQSLIGCEHSEGEEEHVVKEDILYQYVIRTQKTASCFPKGYYMLGRKALLVWNSMDIWIKEIIDKIDTYDTDEEQLRSQDVFYARAKEIIDESSILKNGEESIRNFLPSDIIKRYLRHFLQYYMIQCGQNKDTFTKATKFHEFSHLKQYDLSNILVEGIGKSDDELESFMAQMWQKHNDIHETWHDEETFKCFLRPKLQRLNNLLFEQEDEEDDKDGYFTVRLFRNGKKGEDLCKMLKKILENVTDTCKCFIDVFGGTGAVTAQMQDMFNKRIYNEYDEHFADFVYCVSDNILGNGFDRFCYEKIGKLNGNDNEIISRGRYKVEKTMEEEGMYDKDIHYALTVLAKKLSIFEENNIEKTINKHKNEYNDLLEDTKNKGFTKEKAEQLKKQRLRLQARYQKLMHEQQILEDPEGKEIVKKYIAFYHIAVNAMKGQDEKIKKWINEEENIDYNKMKETAFCLLFSNGFSSCCVSSADVTGVDSEGIKRFNNSLNWKKGSSWLTGFQEKMKGVEVRCEDFRDILKKYQDSETVYYLDPPYFLTAQYNAGFSDGCHLDMLDWLRETESKWVLSCKSEATNHFETTNWKKRIGNDNKLIYVDNASNGIAKLDEYFKGFLYPMKEMSDSDAYLERIGYKTTKEIMVYQADVQPDKKRKDSLYVYRLIDEKYREIMISNIAVRDSEKKVLKDNGIDVQKFEEYFKNILNKTIIE